MSHLQGGRLDLSQLQITYRELLIDYLDQCRGSKAIVWDNNLAGPIGLIATYSNLKEHSVVKMFPLRGGALPECDVSHIIFICRARPELVQLIADNIRSEKSNHKKKYHICFVPRISFLCKEKLQECGLLDTVAIRELNIELFPFEPDLLSMEQGNVIRQYHLEGDSSLLYDASNALLQLQNMYGPVRRVCAKGAAAVQVLDTFKRLLQEQNVRRLSGANNTNPSGRRLSTSTSIQSGIHQLILIDRAVDPITPLLTQLTYEGLIDELFGIHNATATLAMDNNRSATKDDETVEATTSTAGADPLLEDRKKVVLNASDSLYVDLRDKNFNAVGPYLARNAKAVSSQIAEGNNPNGEATLREMKLYVQRLPQLMAEKSALFNHMTIAESIKELTSDHEFLQQLEIEQEFLMGIDLDKPAEYIEALIMQKSKSLPQILRLICLHSLVAGGLKQKVLDSYKRDLVHMYGLSLLRIFLRLEKVGILRAQQTSSTVLSPAGGFMTKSNDRTMPFSQLRKQWKLVVEEEETSESNPTDVTFAYSIYAPITTRLVEHVIKSIETVDLPFTNSSSSSISGNSQLRDTLAQLPGPTVDVILDQYARSNAGWWSEVPSYASYQSNDLRQSFQTNAIAITETHVILVFFIGGCTFSEISTLRFLAQQEDSNVEFVIATTNLINGTTFLNPLLAI